RRAENWQAMRGHWHLAIAVGALSPLGYILVLYALRNGAPLSLVAPAREMSMMLGTLAGWFLLREKVSLGRLAGCAAILAGVDLLGSSCARRRLRTRRQRPATSGRVSTPPTWQPTARPLPSGEPGRPPRQPAPPYPAIGYGRLAGRARRHCARRRRAPRRRLPQA